MFINVLVATLKFINIFAVFIWYSVITIIWLIVYTLINTVKQVEKEIIVLAEG